MDKGVPVLVNKFFEPFYKLLMAKGLLVCMTREDVIVMNVIFPLGVRVRVCPSNIRRSKYRLTMNYSTPCIRANLRYPAEAIRDITWFSYDEEHNAIMFSILHNGLREEKRKLDVATIVLTGVLLKVRPRTRDTVRLIAQFFYAEGARAARDRH